jgi:hypothetical protein
LNLDRLDFHLVIDDVSFLLHHRRFRLSIVDKFQVHHNVMVEVIKVQAVKTEDTLVAFV